MSVVVFGSLNLDIALRLPERMAWGQTLLVDASAEAVGGKGLNQAVGAARFGAVTRMTGAVGADAAGQHLCAALSGYGVDIASVEILPGVTSGRATILIEPEGDNMIAVEPGANHRAAAAPALAAIDADVQVVLAQLETDIDVIARIFASPQASGTCRILNGAPAIADGARLFDLCDMLIFNQSEFAQFAGLADAPQGVDDLLVARTLMTRPGQVVVVTLGATGAAAIMADRTLFVPAYPADRVVDTSGAGDCFCGVLAACIDQGIDLEEALRFANAAASLSVRHEGAAGSIPTRAEVEAFLASR